MNKLTDKALKIYKPPFKLYGQKIYDSQSNPVCDIRGWGYLTGKGHGGLGINENHAAKLQDHIGEMIAEAITKHWVELAKETS